MSGPVQERAEPFGEHVRRLRQERGVSLENFAYATREHSAGLTYSYMGQLERGLRRPSPEAVETVAATLGVEPTAFPEYRLAQARRLLDEREVGLDEALRNLAVFLGEAPGEAEDPAAMEDLGQALEDAARAPEQAPASPGRKRSGRSRREEAA